MKHWLALSLLAGSVVAGVGCTQTVDLSQTLTVSDVSSGWYDAGVVDGKNKLVPSISFRLQNGGTATLSRVVMLVSFWPDGADSDLESREIEVASTGIAPGATSEPALIRSSVGYTLEGPRSDFFTHSQYKDFTVKLFAKRGGTIYQLGERKIERRIIPQDTASSRP